MSTIRQIAAKKIVKPLSRITTMGCAHRSGRVTELCLECGDSIRVDADFKKRVSLRFCSDELTCQCHRSIHLYVLRYVHYVMSFLLA